MFGLIICNFVIILICYFLMAIHVMNLNHTTLALMAHTMCRVTYRSPEGQKRTFSFVSGDPFSKLD